MKPLLFIGISLFSVFGASAGLKVGDPAPNFKLMDADGKAHSLGDYSGDVVVLYFYPKNDTPGCTKQGCSLRDGFAELKARGIVVLGVSYDDAGSHRKFREKYNLPFTLLSDSDKSVSKAYGTDGMLFARRVTFIISPDHKIMHIIEKVDTSDHAGQILGFLSQKSTQ